MILFFGTYSIGLKAQNTHGYGFLKFNLNVDSATLVANNNYYELRKIANGDSIRLFAGKNLINLSVPFDEKKEVYIPIYADSTAILSHIFKDSNLTPGAMNGNVAARYYYDANVMILTDDESEIFLDDTLMGTGFVQFIMEKKNAQVTIKNPDFGKKRFPLKIRGSRVNFREFYRRPKKSNARFLAYFPGASQLYKRQYLKSGAFLVASYIFVKRTFDNFVEHSNEMDVFNNYTSRYEKADTPEDALLWGDLAEAQSDKIKQLDSRRKKLLLSSLIIYGLNILDAYKSHPKGGYREDQKPLEFYLSINTGTIRYNF